MKNRVTIVIPYKNVGNGEELQLALRSIARNANFNYQVVLVGDAPEWVNKEKVLCFNPEITPRSEFPKAFNVIEKIKFILQLDDVVDDELLLMYDDIVFVGQIKKADIKEIISLPEIQETEIQNYNASVVWKNIMANTFKALKRNSMSVYNFETHLPRLFDKKKLADLFSKFGFSKRPYLMSTLYFNEYHTEKPPRILSENPKYTKVGLYVDSDFENNKEQISNHKFLNWSESQWSADLKDFLFFMFPEKSPFEI